MSDVTFTALGGSGVEIGASCFLISSNGKDIILDSGLHPKKEGKASLPDFSLLRRAPDAVLITHGHVDHSGSLPYLMKHFPGASGYATKPTVQIMDRMLHNSVSVMSMLALERGIREYPLYTHRDADNALRRTYGLRFDREFSPVGDAPVRARFHHAGHVLGSASVLLKLESHTIYYTGDVCAANQYLMRGMDLLDKDVQVDTLIIESTRGAQDESTLRSYGKEIRRFTREIKAVLDGGGVVMVPCFALGRTQEMLNIIDKLQTDGQLPKVQVYASGLGRAVYEIYMRNRQYLRPEAPMSPLEQFKRIGDVWDPKVARDLLREPCIIVATSGMMIENTPSAMIAKEMVKEDRHGIFFVGYLDPDTLGYALLHSEPGQKLAFEPGGKEVPVTLRNIRNFQFSAHAPRQDLLRLIEHIEPRNVVFVHGDEEAVAWMRDNAPAGCTKIAPAIGETVAL